MKFHITRYKDVFKTTVIKRVSLVAQTVKNTPATRETWVWSLGWEDLLEEAMATHCSLLAWRILKVRGAWQASVQRVTKESDMTEQITLSLFSASYYLGEFK